MNFEISDVLADVEILGVTCRNMAHLIRKLVPVMLYDCTSAIDLTPGSGAFWSDDEPVPFPVLLSPNDFLDTPYTDEEFDSTFFDPPHLAGQGARAFMRERYGTYTARELPGVIYHGTKEAWRITRHHLIVKVTDHVNSARFQHQSGWVVDAMRQDPYQIVTIVHAPVGSKRWNGFIEGQEPPQSARSISSTLLVFRRGSQEHSASARLRRLSMA